VLILWPEHRPRAFLRAELIERGFDAIGAANVRAAIRYPRIDLILVESEALAGGGAFLLPFLAEKHGGPPMILCKRSQEEISAGQWAQILSRPCTIGQIADAVERLLKDTSSWSTACTFSRRNPCSG
jgi:hypothetical protein